MTVDPMKELRETGSTGLIIVLPGQDASAAVFGDDVGDEVLVMMMDPFKMSLTLPVDPVEWVQTARFLRELGHSAYLLADRIDPFGQGQPTWAPLGSVKRIE